MIPAGLAALIPVGYIVYLALSKKTGPALKRVAIGALVLIVFAFFLCAILLLMSGAPVVTKQGYSDLPPVPAEKGEDNSPILIALAIVLFFLIMVIIISIREQQRLEKIKKTGQLAKDKKGAAGKGEDSGQYTRKN